jgi:hypothetical protein
MQLIATISRQIWLRRNKWVYDGIFTPPAQVVRSARDQIEAFSSAEQSRREQLVLPRTMMETVWSRPGRGIIKVNWDAALDQRQRRIGMGILARDHDGQVIAAMCSSKPFLLDPVSAEAFAAWRMAGFCGSLGARHIVVEGDALEIVHALRKDSACWGRYGNLVDDAKNLLNSIDKWEVQHVKRSGNEAAHRLAKLALSIREEEFWRLECPPCIQDLVLAESGNF